MAAFSGGMSGRCARGRAWEPAGHSAAARGGAPARCKHWGPRVLAAVVLPGTVHAAQQASSTASRAPCTPWPPSPASRPSPAPTPGPCRCRRPGILERANPNGGLVGGGLRACKQAIRQSQGGAAAGLAPNAQLAHRRPHLERGRGAGHGGEGHKGMQRLLAQLAERGVGVAPHVQHLQQRAMVGCGVSGRQDRWVPAPEAPHACRGACSPASR